MWQKGGSAMIERLESRLLLSTPSLSDDGTLTVTGTTGDDHITINSRGKQLIVREGKLVFSYPKKSSNISKVLVNTLAGKDRININGNTDVSVDAGDGNDIIHSGGGDDVLIGGNGNDRIFGGAGDDSISGDAGRDVLVGGAGDDQLDTADEARDRLSGGRGNDSATVDMSKDRGSGIEDYLTLTTQSVGSNLAVTFSGSSLANVVANAGSLNFNLPATTDGFQSVTIYASDLSGAKASLYNAVVSANAFGSTDIFDSGLALHPASGMGDHMFIRPTRIGDIN